MLGSEDELPPNAFLQTTQHFAANLRSEGTVVREDHLHHQLHILILLDNAIESWI